MSGSEYSYLYKRIVCITRAFHPAASTDFTFPTRGYYAVIYTRDATFEPAVVSASWIAHFISAVFSQLSFSQPSNCGRSLG